MTRIGTRDNATLRRLWADLERAGSDFTNGKITEHELLQRHYLDSARALSDWDAGERSGQ
jgi:hypothetical protein